jgi:hypothetical protein
VAYETPRLSLDLGDGNTDGTIPSNHLHKSIRSMSESITSSLGYEDCLYDSRQHKNRSTLRCRVGRSSHYSDARRSMDSHRGTLGPVEFFT